MTLEQLSPGKRAMIAGVDAAEALRARMSALGLRVGREVAVVRRARLQGPLHIRVGTTDLIIRPKEARLIRLAVADALK
jgi:ferrous iron transport protein A